MSLDNKKKVWSALEDLWTGMSLRQALKHKQADIMAFFDSKHEKEIYIPAFEMYLHKMEYELLIEKGKDIALQGNEPELIDYKGD